MKTPRPHNTCLLLTGLLLLASIASADIYRWSDDEGNVRYSDQKPTENAQPVTPSGAINSYRPAPAAAGKKPPETATLSTLSAATEQTPPATAASSDGLAPLTEQQCQQDYNRSCEEISNWREAAEQRCGDDPRCADEDFLERKYRPRSNEELRQIALRAAIRNNRHDKKIALFLTKKYTSYCQDQAALLCKNKLSNRCVATMRYYCEDPRDLQDIFNQYDNLNANEKRAIINKAKSLAMANGNSTLDYEQMLASLIEILVSQAMLGI